MMILKLSSFLLKICLKDRSDIFVLVDSPSYTYSSTVCLARVFWDLSLAPDRQKHVHTRTLAPDRQKHVYTRTLAPDRQKHVHTRTLAPDRQKHVHTRTLAPDRQKHVHTRTLAPDRQKHVHTRTLAPDRQKHVHKNSGHTQYPYLKFWSELHGKIRHVMVQTILLSSCGTCLLLRKCRLRKLPEKRQTAQACDCCMPSMHLTPHARYFNVRSNTNLQVVHNKTQSLLCFLWSSRLSSVPQGVLR